VGSVKAYAPLVQQATNVTAAEARLLEKAKKAFAGAGGLLDGIAWRRSVEREFFAHKAEKLPRPTYDVDRSVIETRLAALDDLEADLTTDDALVRLLKKRVESHRLGARMLLAVGTKEFGKLSREAFGGAATTRLDSDTSNLDFAEHLGKRLGTEDPKDEESGGEKLDAKGLGDYVNAQLARSKHPPKVEIFIDEDMSAKAIAGKTRLRIREDATFEPEEARSLFLHEVETHLFTAQNGEAQPIFDFLDTGGPRSTRTQEGLAVFSELYAQAITISRLRRLVERVNMVGMAENGASFLDLYRYLTEKGVDQHSAYLDAARICRGGLVEGGAPFTKDAVYLAGLSEVYDFLRLAVTHEGRDVVEVLVTGRLALDEMEPLLALRDEGRLAPPKYQPSWLRRWGDLLAHFAFSSFLAEIDLHFVARKHAWLAKRIGASMDPPSPRAKPSHSAHAAK